MKRFQRFLPVIFTLLFLPLLSAQSVHPDLEKVLNRKLDSMRTVLNVKSLGAAVQLPDNSVWAKSKGISSVFPVDTVTTQHTYAIGSVTKTITSACILQLADEGLLSLNDSLHEWLDTLPFVNPNITIRQLLRHQSGLYDVITDQQYAFDTQTDIDSIWELEDVLTTYLHAPLFQPGANWSYSNTNFILLGMIIKAITGKPYYQEYRERFYEPLSLTSLSVPPYDPLPTKIAHLWLDITGDMVTDDANNFFTHWRSFYSTAGPAGGYFATPTDIARWMKAFMTGTMHTPGIMQEAKTMVTTSLPAGTKYGLGIMERKFAGLTAYGHGGDIAYSSIVYYFPAKDISIAVLCNDSKSPTWNSWALAPVMTVLLNAYMDFEALTTVSNPVEPYSISTTAFPNPFSERLTVSTTIPTATKNIRLVLKNVMGETVAQKNAEHVAPGELTLPLGDLERLPNGVYFLSTLLDEKLVETVKVFKTGRS